MRLPGVTACWVPDLKLTGYLLSVSHEDGSGKAKFFESFGFAQDRPEQLRSALIDHASAHDVVSQRDTEFGTMFEIVGRIRSPDGRDPVVLVVWIIENNDDRPRLVTAIPAREQP